MKKNTTTEVKISMNELLVFMGFDVKKYEVEEIDALTDDLIVYVMEKEK